MHPLMNRIARYFSVLNKIKDSERLRQGQNFKRSLTHLFNDQPVGNGDYQTNKQRLSPFQQYLIETKSMERPFTGNLWGQLSSGFYHCVVCDTRLFTFNHKYQSQTGHASFWRSIDSRVNIVTEQVIFDEVNQPRAKHISLNPTYKRCECANCKSHLGAVFFDGPPPSFLRYSINSALLKFYDMPDFPDPNILKKQKKQKSAQKVIRYIR